MREPVSPVIHTYRQRFNVKKPYFNHAPPANLSLIIAIPSCKEPDIATTLNSLAACEKPRGKVEVIITINAPAGASEEVLLMNQKTVGQIKKWEENKPEFLDVLVIREEALPPKDAGAGLARKIGMDEAAQRWAMLQKDGVIVCLDADCTVTKNYLKAAEHAFSDPSVRVAHFCFEHIYQQLNDTVLRQGILLYELHLRCYVLGLKSAGYPFAVHTVGSCMVVRASAYAQAGGMNRRKAGEDFYFIQKLVPSGGWRDIGEATVFPSARISDRVPFGTGRAQLEWQFRASTESQTSFLTYNAEIYALLKPVFDDLSKWYDGAVDLHSYHPVIREFFEAQNFFAKICEMKKHAKSLSAFTKRFWHVMDGFMVLKLTHYIRDHGFPNQPVQQVANALLLQRGFAPSHTTEGLLEQFRKLDRGQDEDETRVPRVN